MSWGWRKRFKLGPLTLNLSKRAASVTGKAGRFSATHAAAGYGSRCRSAAGGIPDHRHGGHEAGGRADELEHPPSFLMISTLPKVSSRPPTFFREMTLSTTDSPGSSATTPW